MKCRIYDHAGRTLLREVEAVPSCGEDFCDRCGDCLACYRNGCYSGGKWTLGVACSWVLYGEEEAAERFGSAPSPSSGTGDGR